jgi:leader peptidase (prepilin peptidase)/N-methyltransferase
LGTLAALSLVSLAVTPLLYIAAAFAGLAAGVAVNALADRVEGDEEPPWCAACCHKCRAPLPAARYVPLRSFAPSRRRCAQCGAVTSMRRPLLEAALALLFPLLLAHVASPLNAAHLPVAAIFALEALACCVLAFIFAVDLEHHLILDVATYPAIAALVTVALLFDHKALAAMLFGVALCGGLFLLLYGLGFLLYRQEALGFGDVKLAVLVGLVVGWPAVGTAIVLTALLGAAFSVLLLGLGAATRRSFIPFGIFLCAGAVLTLLLAQSYW